MTELCRFVFIKS